MNVSTATLVALLQRTPVLRVIAAADEFVSTSPIGTVLKSAVAVIASLGAVDSMAGATVLATSITPAPSGSLPNFAATAGTQITPVAFTITNTMNIASWLVTGTIPPGLTLTTKEPNGGNLTGPGKLDATTAGTSGNGWSSGTTGNNTTTPILEGTPTTAGTYTFMLQGFAEAGETGGSGGTFVGTGISAVFPFTVVVAPAAASGAAPVFTTQPISVTVTGGRVALDAVASNAPTYQWMWNGTTPVPGATSSLLVISDATASVGSYTCVATNSVGTVTSTPATVAVTSTTDVGRLINLSARAEVGTGGNIIFAGFVIGGSGSLPVLIRASGPAIAVAPFNVPGTLADPQLQLFDGQTLMQTANGWATDAANITATAAAVGAFSWNTPGSHDSALDLSLPAAGYTAQVAGESGDSGDAIVEVYDATPSGTFTSSSPKLINLAARVDVGTGANALFAGFVIRGSSALTVLIRASGPAIAVAPFNVPGTLPDPQLTLQNQTTGAVLATNSSWGGDAQISSTAASVGAFGWGVPTSHDSALLITLPPGNYTAAAVGSSGDTGVAIVEVYDVP
jgi:Immunoglobulin domain